MKREVELKKLAGILCVTEEIRKNGKWEKGYWRVNRILSEINGDGK
ncbi:hypothetical protein P4H66_15445 [Paenibacillus dokdonensis]|uniref:Uncharacterized protein n=1 Tax=Paenibacillus dokdonensis TaxID=2567944 RepID=A0ABU6GNC7_9BACL|nr:hypothetical protein [Paenibacillus dokdonensis]MEC0241246.1 hypothetical protein [Paenibacillus dokdonensis]